MKYTGLFFVGILTMTLLSCQSETATETAAKQETVEILEAAESDSKVKVYTGTIDGKYELEVQLVTEKSKIQGFYLHQAEGILYPIKGVKREDGTVELSAYDDTGGTVELFIGKINDKSIKGEWFNKREDGADEKSTFSFTETSIDIAQEDLKALKGTYQYSVQGYTSYIIIEPIGTKTVKIQAMITYRSCTGELMGEAYVYNNKLVGFYGEDNCFLKLEIGKNSIDASEISCSYYHGFGCIFDGKYRKVSDELNWIMDS